MGEPNDSWFAAVRNNGLSGHVRYRQAQYTTNGVEEMRHLKVISIEKKVQPAVVEPVLLAGTGTLKKPVRAVSI